MVKFIKRVTKSGKGYILWLPKDVVHYLRLNENSTVEIEIKKLKNEE